MIKNIKKLGTRALRLFLNRLGFDVVRFAGRSSPLGRRMMLLRHYGVDLVIDVGANVGQYALELRRLGYRGQIVSFEPLPTALTTLRARAARDPQWIVMPLALGNHAGRAKLYVAANSVSSSLLPMLPRHLQAAPSSRYVGEAEVEICRLDDVFDGIVGASRTPFLKVDVQGGERGVLEGAASALQRLAGLQIELSLVPLYEGSPRLPEIVTFLEGHGFLLMSVEPGFSDPDSGQLLQVDGIFFRPRPDDPEERG